MFLLVKYLYIEKIQISAPLRTAVGIFFSIKDGGINILDFVGHIGSIATTQPCRGSAEAAVDNMKRNELVILTQ